MTTRLLRTKQIFHSVENQSKKTSYTWAFFLLTFAAGFISSFFLTRKLSKTDGKDIASN